MKLTAQERATILKMIDFFGAEEENLDPKVLDSITEKLKTPEQPKGKLYQFSANRMAFATINVRAKDQDEAIERAQVQAEGLDDEGWTLDGEIEIDGLVGDDGFVEPI